MSIFGDNYESISSTKKSKKYNRIKNPVVWTSFLGLLLLICNTFGLLEKIGVTNEEARNIGAGIISVLIGFGILYKEGE